MCDIANADQKLQPFYPELFPELLITKMIKLSEILIEREHNSICQLCDQKCEI